LSEKLPQVGDKVWLADALYVGAPPSQYQHSATITSIQDAGNICYKFDNAKISFQGTQGAPIIDRDGKVVAVHIGAKDKMEPLVATGNPTSRFLPFLKKALAADRERHTVD